MELIPYTFSSLSPWMNQDLPHIDGGHARLIRFYARVATHFMRAISPSCTN